MKRNRKTILITSLNPFSTRNILFTDVFCYLKSNPDVRIVLICPDYKINYFKRHFSRENISIEGIKIQVISFKDILFRFISNNSINNRTRYIHQRRELIRDKKKIKFLLARTVALSSHLPFQKKIVRFLHMLFVSKDKFKNIFNAYNPDLVFATDVFHDDDIRFLLGAKARGIQTIGMVRSWDNISNKGVMRVKPHKLIVSNKIMKDEATKHEDMKEEDVFVGGMPQFDYYLNEERSSREEFFKRINLNPKKRLIMFSPHGNRFHDTDWHIMVILQDAIRNGELPRDVQVLVRFPPNDNVSLGDFVQDENFHIDRPGKQFREGAYSDQELDKEAMRHLADSLYYIDVLVNYNSSIIIDAAAFRKPSVGIAFDGWDTKPNIYHSVARFMEYSHTQYLLKTGGLWVVRSREELLHAINTYLENPDYHEQGRKEILETQAWKFDGKSGKRIADFIYQELQSADL